MVDLDVNNVVLGVVEIKQFEDAVVLFNGSCINEATDLNFKVEVGFVEDDIATDVAIGVISTEGDEETGFISTEGVDETGSIFTVAIDKTGFISTLAIDETGSISTEGVDVTCFISTEGINETGSIFIEGVDVAGFISAVGVDDLAVNKAGFISAVGVDDLAVNKAGFIFKEGDVETAVNKTGFGFIISSFAFWRESKTFVPRELIDWAPDVTAVVSKTGLPLTTADSSLCFRITLPVLGLELLHLITFKIFRFGFIVSLSLGNSCNLAGAAAALSSLADLGFNVTNGDGCVFSGGGPKNRQESKVHCLSE